MVLTVLLCKGSHFLDRFSENVFGCENRPVKTRAGLRDSSGRAFWHAVVIREEVLGVVIGLVGVECH